MESSFSKARPSAPNPCQPNLRQIHCRFCSLPQGPGGSATKAEAVGGRGLMVDASPCALLVMSSIPNLIEIRRRGCNYEVDEGREITGHGEIGNSRYDTRIIIILPGGRTNNMAFAMPRRLNGLLCFAHNWTSACTLALQGGQTGAFVRVMGTRIWLAVQKSRNTRCAWHSQSSESQSTALRCGWQCRN